VVLTAIEQEHESNESGKDASQGSRAGSGVRGLSAGKPKTKRQKAKVRAD